MRATRYLLTVFTLFFLSLTAYAAVPAGPVMGQDFVPLTPSQPTIAGNKVEVIEFFAYYCPHCYVLDQPLAGWIKAQGDNIAFKRIHTSITGEPVPQQRLYYTLEAMGREEEFHDRILNEIHVQRKRLSTDAEIIAFISEQPGMDKQKFSELYNSFSVESKVNRAIQMQRSYSINTWPTIVLDGGLVTSPPLVGAKMDPYNEIVAQNAMLKVMDALVGQLHRLRNP
jgi:thiol:disulfide interchange protein DsbA